MADISGSSPKGTLEVPSHFEGAEPSTRSKLGRRTDEGRSNTIDLTRVSPPTMCPSEPIFIDLTLDSDDIEFNSDSVPLHISDSKGFVLTKAEQISPAFRASPPHRGHEAEEEPGGHEVAQKSHMSPPPETTSESRMLPGSPPKRKQIHPARDTQLGKRDGSRSPECASKRPRAKLRESKSTPILMSFERQWRVVQTKMQLQEAQFIAKY